MKKALLSLALLGGLTTAARAQWVLQNTAGFTTPPGYYSTDLHTVSEQVAWQLVGSFTEPRGGVSRTANGGATWA